MADFKKGSYSINLPSKSGTLTTSTDVPSSAKVTYHFIYFYWYGDTNNKAYVSIFFPYPGRDAKYTDVAAFISRLVNHYIGCIIPATGFVDISGVRYTLTGISRSSSSSTRAANFILFKNDFESGSAVSSVKTTEFTIDNVEHFTDTTYIQSYDLE